MTPSTRSDRKDRKTAPPQAVTDGGRRRQPSAATAVRDPDSLGARLRRAEIVLINGLKVALALEYSPGTTPVVLACGKGKTAEEILWASQELDLPIVELGNLEPSDVDQFQPNQEIPEPYYHHVAQALALIYRTAPSPGLVRYVRTVPPRQPRSARRQALLAEFEDIFSSPPVYVEVGEGLKPYEAEWNEPLQQLRQRIASDMGLLLPPIPLRPAAHLEPSAFVIRFREVPIQKAIMDLPLDSTEKLFVLVNRLKQAIYRQGWELLGFAEVETQLDIVRKKNRGLYAALFPHHFSVAALRQILRNLLREQLSVRDLPTILEVILENLSRSQDPDLLTECVRMAYSRSLCQKYQDADQFINALILDPQVEKTLFTAIRENAGGRWLDLPSEEALRVLRAIETAIKELSTLHITPVILTTPVLRRFLGRMAENVFPDVPVLSYNEIAPLTEVRSVGTVSF